MIVCMEVCVRLYLREAGCWVKLVDDLGAGMHKQDWWGVNHTDTHTCNINMSSPVLQDVIQSALLSLGTQLISDQLQNETKKSAPQLFRRHQAFVFFLLFIYLFILIIFLLLFSSGNAIKPKKVHGDKLTRNPIATISAIILIIFKQEKKKKFTGIALFD